MKKTIFTVSFLTLLTLILLSCQGRGEETAAVEQETPPLAVEALTVTQGKLVGTIEAAGTVEGINEAYIVSETQGIIEEVNFSLGQKIAPEQVLVKVDDNIAYYNMIQAKEQWETAQLDLTLQEKLYNDGKSSRAQYSRAKSAANGARAMYEMASKTYEDCSVQSPISGYVAEKQNSIAIGSYMSPGSPIARIVDISSLKMEIAVGEREIGFFKAGLPASIVVPAGCPDVVFEGTVDAVAAGSNPVTGSYSVIIVWENSCGENIKSGMSGTVSVDTLNEESVTLIPSGAVLRKGGSSYVFVVRDGAAEQQKITPGRQQGNRLEILGGLDDGETLILSGLTSLKQGSKVNPDIVGESGSWQ